MTTEAEDFPQNLERLAVAAEELASFTDTVAYLEAKLGIAKIS